MGKHAIITNGEYEELLERACEDRMLLVEVENKFEITEYVEKMWALCNSVKFNRSELKKLMNGSQGHGYAAEYANNTLDRILGKNVINAAQQLDSSGRQIKDGADRIVNGVEYQSKYRKDALTTLGS